MIPTPFFKNCVFLGATAAVPVTGFFLNRQKVRVGSPFSYSIPYGTGSVDGVTFDTIYSPALVPPEADTVEVSFGGKVFMDTYGASNPEFKTNPSLFIPIGSGTYNFDSLGNILAINPPISGVSVYRNIDMGATGAVIKASAGQVYGWYISNQNPTSTRCVKIYDKATAPTNADTPVYTLVIPAGSAANVAFPNGVQFTNGIGIRATTGVADNDNTSPATNGVIVNVNYK